MRTKVKYPRLRAFTQQYLFKVVIAFVVIELMVIAFYQTKNNKPVALPDESHVYLEYSVDIPVLQNDSDKDREDDLEIINLTQPENGKAILNRRVITYTPANAFTGKDSFTYQLSDGEDESEPVTVSVTVSPNLKPNATLDEVFVFPWAKKVEVFPLLNDSDREGDQVSLVEFTAPKNGFVTRKNNKLIYQYSDQTGLEDEFTYTISDGKRISDPQMIKISIKSVENPKFGEDEIFGDFRNYKQRTVARWDFKEDNGNTMVGINTTQYSRTNGNLPGEYTLSDKVIEGDFRLKLRYQSTEDFEKNTYADLLVVFAFENPKQYGFFLMFPPGNSHTGFEKVSKGKRIALTKQGVGIPDQNWHVLILERRGNKMTAWVDGEEVVSAEDEEFGLSGKVGFGSLDDQGWFDDFEVEAL